MPSNYTPNYNLNQWEPDDRVLRTDFNADNAKIEAALSSLEERVSALDSLAGKLAFFVGRLALFNVAQSGKAFFTGASVHERFLFPGYLSLTGDITVQNGVATLEGAGKTGTISVPNYSTPDGVWSRAVMWVEQTPGAVSVKLNDVPMERGRSFWTTDIGDVHHYQEFTCTGLTPDDTVGVTLELNTGTGRDLKIFSYSVLLF